MGTKLFVNAPSCYAARSHFSIAVVRLWEVLEQEEDHGYQIIVFVRCSKSCYAARRHLCCSSSAVGGSGARGRTWVPNHCICEMLRNCCAARRHLSILVVRPNNSYTALLNHLLEALVNGWSTAEIIIQH